MFALTGNDIIVGNQRPSWPIAIIQIQPQLKLLNIDFTILLMTKHDI